VYEIACISDEIPSQKFLCQFFNEPTIPYFEHRNVSCFGPASMRRDSKALKEPAVKSGWPMQCFMNSNPGSEGRILRVSAGILRISAGILRISAAILVEF
jgi:hypothetical protein